MAIKPKRVRVSARSRTKYRIRSKVIGVAERPRLTVFRSAKHLYAQVIEDVQGKTLASASTLDPEVRDAVKGIEAEGRSKSSKSVAAARAVGIVLAKRAQAKKVEQVVFDRNGFVYHGRIQAIADGAREGGLKF